MRYGVWGGGGGAKILWLNSEGSESDSFSGLSQKFSSGMGNLCQTAVTSQLSYSLLWRDESTTVQPDVFQIYNLQVLVTLRGLAKVEKATFHYFLIN
jgi:hypothetical protein